MERRTEQGPALRSAREQRGWDVAQLVVRLRQAAMAQGTELACMPGAVERSVRHWESGRYVPSPFYRGLLTEVYSLPHAALGLVEPPEREGPDSERWGRIFARYHGWMVRRIRSQVRNHALAEDLASETFIRVGQSLHLVDSSEDEHLFGWIGRHAKWVIADHFGATRVQREQLAGPADDDAVHQDPAATDELSVPEEFVTGRIEFGRLMALLPEQQQQVFVLRIIDGLSSTQVATQLGLSRSTVFRRQNEALATLRRHVAGEPEPAVAADSAAQTVAA